MRASFFFNSKLKVNDAIPLTFQNHGVVFQRSNFLGSCFPTYSARQLAPIFPFFHSNIRVCNSGKWKKSNESGFVGDAFPQFKWFYQKTIAIFASSSPDPFEFSREGIGSMNTSDLIRFPTWRALASEKTTPM